MSWWGKLIGGALGLYGGGPIGMLIGAIIGQQFDAEATLRAANKNAEDDDFAPGATERVQTVFFTATFAVMGRLAKADGQVSSAEVAMAESVMAEMNLTPAMQQMAKDLFRKGRAHDFDLDHLLAQLKQELHRRKNLVQRFLEIQFQAAYSDGTLHKAEQQLLKHIANHLGVSNLQFAVLAEAFAAHFRFQHQEHAYHNTTTTHHDQLADAYKILGVDSGCDDKALKLAYRRMRSRSHPDKLIAQGLPDEMVNQATEKAKEIKKAYELIKQARAPTNR